MNFKDKWVTNEDGNRFVFTVEMQRDLQDAGLPIEPASLDQLPDSPAADRGQQSGQPKSKSSRPPQKKDAEITVPTTIQIDPETGKYVGRVKWFNGRKGYGFIIRGGGEELFFHKSNAVTDASSFNEGEWVLYDIEETHKGPEATEIEPYEGDTSKLELNN